VRDDSTYSGSRFGEDESDKSVERGIEMQANEGRNGMDCGGVVL
jgi:hypothetical protein